jgi:DNA-binding NarL/FixJ family response regulator
MIRLLIADDHAIVRDGLKHLFVLTQDLVVAKEATNALEVIDFVIEPEIDLLLLDMNMPGNSGTELIRKVKTIRPNLPVFIYSMHDETSLLVGAFNAGASGYVTKSSNPQMLIEGIRKLAAGGRFVDPVLAEKMIFSDEYPPKDQPHNLLSDRELEVFKLLVSGNSVNVIADKMFISNKTVSAHKINLQRKLNIHNMVDMVHYAIQHGISKDIQIEN